MREHTTLQTPSASLAPCGSPPAVTAASVPEPLLPLPEEQPDPFSLRVQEVTAAAEALPGLPAPHSVKALPDLGNLRDDCSEVRALALPLAWMLRSSLTDDQTQLLNLALLVQDRLTAAASVQHLILRQELTEGVYQGEREPSDHLGEVLALRRERTELRKQVVALHARLEEARNESGRGRNVRTVTGPPTQDWQQTLLTALKERDEERERNARLEQQLARSVTLETDGRLLHTLSVASNREHSVLLAHFRNRLAERFQVTLTYAEVSDLDRDARTLPVSGYTRRGTPFQTLSIGGAAVYAVLTPDVNGQLTLTTALTQTQISNQRPGGPTTVF